MRISLNFLAAFHSLEGERRQAAYRFTAGLFLVLLAFVIGQFYFSGLILAALLSGVVLILSLKLDWGLYILGAISFFTGWIISLSGTFLQKSLGLPVSFTIQAPVADLVALLLLVALLIVYVFATDRKPLRECAPGAVWYGLFLVAATLSALHAYDHQIAAGIKYILRPLLFSYLAFLVLPLAVIRTKKVFYRFLAVWFVVGLLIGVYGFTSLWYAGDGWSRVEPYPILGQTPLGVNHNQLAEPLVALVPLFFWLILWSKKEAPAAHTFFKGAFVFIVLITALTLSRAAWLALIAETAIVALFNRIAVKEFWRGLGEKVVPIVAVAVVVVGYMGFFLVSPTVSTATESRSVMLEISQTYFRYSPWIGFGPGTFYSLMSETKYFIMEYGQPLDSHGFIQKVLVEEGIIGFVFFVGFLVAIFQKLLRSTKEHQNQHHHLAECLLAVAVGVVLFQVFNTSYFTSTMWLPLGVAFAGFELLRKKELQ